ncbi:MAG: DNA-directed RNA polymerase subunit omega [Candidatus Eisenbacteria bacterium]|uniref:DNA-directed RNA polymerase subunit omega n=1 Tax=Eiseniibacteriota bacterium TaxID=2212470 RepID=A0A7Y2E8P6_UNCEI|nr:DNA-directed RNA polymerase subunit omega [Candidatus Eisenbacteria bacterium]
MTDRIKPEDLETKSKYELVVIASREARRLNEVARASGRELKRRVTDVAWERLSQGSLQYTYADPEPEEEPQIPMDEAAAAPAPAPEEAPTPENA